MHTRCITLYCTSLCNIHVFIHSLTNKAFVKSLLSEAAEEIGRSLHGGFKMESFWSANTPSIGSVFTRASDWSLDDPRDF
jgi:hypothetical protein